MNGVLTVFRNRVVLLARGDEGVVLALSLAFLLPIFVLTVCIFALQETMVRKAELQNAVDAAAYSAATVQSDYLSRFATINKVLGWVYVQRERARADYAMIRLCEEAKNGLERDRRDCENNNRRSCCAKHRVQDQDWGVGTLTSSSSEDSKKIKWYSPREVYNIIKNGVTSDGSPLNQGTKRYYSYGNNVADIKTLTFPAVNAGAALSHSKLYTKINTYGKTMEKCRTSFTELEREFPKAVEAAAREILQLNLNQTETDYYTQVTVPTIGDIIKKFSCSAEDEKRLFQAAGLDADKCTPQKALGYGADRFFVLGSTLTNLTGPSWLGRKVQTGWEIASMSVSTFLLSTIGILAIFWFLGPIGRAALLVAAAAFTIKLCVQDSRQRPVDEAFQDIVDARAPGGEGTCSCRHDGPCRVLNFAGDKYLSMEWQFFWKRYAAFGFRGIPHVCVPPVKVMGRQLGCHKWGMSRASIWRRTYGNGEYAQCARAGNPVVGKAIGAQGRKLANGFFGPDGAIRIIAARDNPNPLRIFGGQDALKGLLGKIPGSKAADLVKRYDAGGIYQVFNAHLSDNQALQFNKFEGSQCPNFLFAVAASRTAIKNPASGGAPYTLYRPTSLNDGTGYCTLSCTDWEPTLMSFRGSAYTGLDTPGNILKSSAVGILGRLKDAAAFEKQMRLGTWYWHHRSANHRHGGSRDWDTPKELKKLSAASAERLSRLNDTRGPYPTTIEHGSSILFWGHANEFINH